MNNLLIIQLNALVGDSIEDEFSRFIVIDEDFGLDAQS